MARASNVDVGAEMSSEKAESVEEWIALYRVHRRSAEVLIDDPLAFPQAWSNAGFCVECLLKAAIMSSQRLNRWPSRTERRDLYVHTIRDLVTLLGASISPDDRAAPAWHVAMSWQRGHTYVATMPKVVATDCMSAVFCEEGVVEWLFQNYLQPYKS
jgi:hypothetical protein